MKIHGSKKIHYDSGPNMTPLVDVVMVILIFLMMTGSFGTMEHYLVNNAGFQFTGTSGAKLPPNFVPPVNLVLQMDLDPNTADQPIRQQKYSVSMAGVVYKSYDPLRQRLAELAKSPQYSDKKTVQVVIKPGQRVLQWQIIDVYQAAIDAGFEKVAFTKAH